MPYFVFRITPGSTPLVKDLDLLDQFDRFQDAKRFARARRAELEPDSRVTIKVMFAASQLEAEEKLQEHREPPILQEWEK